MSLGIFRSIRGSYTEVYWKEGDRVIRALNKEFARRGIPPYCDPDPDEGELRQLPCGNAGASTFAAIRKRARRAGLPWTLDTLRGDRRIALPIPFSGKFAVVVERLALIVPLHQEFAVRTVRDELAALAPLLSIPLRDGVVPYDIASRLADCEPLPGESAEMAGTLENERGLWLDLHLACRYSLEDKTPVVIA